MCASLLLSGQLAGAQTCSPPGLVAWWPGQGNAVDVTGAHNGTLVGGVTFAPGRVGSAFNFNGWSSVQVPDSPALNPTNAITVEAWINPTAGQGGYQPIIKKNGTNDQSGYALEMAGDTGMCFNVFVHGRGWAGACAGITPGQWSHVAGVYDGQNVMLYINGVLAASSPALGTIEPPNGNLGIGTDPTLNRRYTGLIDDPAVFGRALTAKEIQAIFSVGSVGKCVAFDLSAAPTLNLPTDITASAETSGTVVNFSAYAWDPIDGRIPATCSPPSGSVFPIGRTSVSCTATDSRNLVATGSFNVTVAQKTTPACSPSGLVAWWPGERSAVDVAGSHDGTLVGGATFRPGIAGSAFEFDGTRFVQVPDSPALNPTNAITVEAWINPTPGQGGYPPIIKKNGTNDQSGYALEMGGDDRGMCFYVFVHGKGWAGACAEITPGQWTHVAGVYNGQDVMLYINGVLAASSPALGTIEPPNGNLGIGRDPTLGRQYAGLIDEPAIFNRALAPSEIAAIYSSGTSKRCSSPVTTGVFVRSHTLIYDTAGALSAWLFKDAKPLAGKTIEFLVRGASAGFGTTDAAGFATVVLQPSHVGFYQGGLEVRFAGDGDLGPQTARADLFVYNPAAILSSDRSAPLPIARIVGGGFSSSPYDGDANPAIDSLRDLVYVPNASDGTVVVAEGKTGQPRPTITLHANALIGMAGAMALDQVRNRLYIADRFLPLLWIVDPAGAAPVLQTVALPAASRWVEFNPSTGLLYVVHRAEGTVTVVDPASPLNLVSIPSCAPHSIAINPVTNLVYVATGCGPIEIVDGDPQRLATFNTIVGELPVFKFGLLTAAAVDRRTNAVYVLTYSAAGGNVIHVFDGQPGSSTLHQELDVLPIARSSDWAMWPTGIGIDSGRGLLYVRASDWQGNMMCDSSLTAVDVTSHAVSSVTLLPWHDQNCSFGRVGVNPNTGRIYVTSTNNVTTVLQEIRAITLATDTSAGPVTVPSSQVSVTFAAVTAPGRTTIEQIDPGTVNAALPGGFQIDGGPAFEISTTASVSTPIRLCFDASSVTDPATFATLAVLHGENGVFVDRTVSRDLATRTICASVSSLSPFVIARRIGPAYHLQPLYDVAKAATAGSTIPVRVRLVDASGRNVSSANITLKAMSITPAGGGTTGSVSDAGRSNPNGFFRFDPTLGGYVFNLSTRGLKAGAFQLLVEGPDKPLRYAVALQIR